MVTAIDTMTFIGLNDSVKTITLNVKDGNRNVIPYYLNGKTLMLSKNYGLIELPDLYIFPDSYSQSGYFTFKLVGKTNPNKGKVNLTSREIFDFDVGDEFHISRSYKYLDMPGFYQYSWLTILKVLDRTDYAGEDSVRYTWSICQYHGAYTFVPVRHKYLCFIK
jgi:hypothetical protein